MKIKINDPFGFQKAINFEKLDDPKTLKKLSDIFLRNPLSLPGSLCGHIVHV